MADENQDQQEQEHGGSESQSGGIGTGTAAKAMAAAAATGAAALAARKVMSGRGEGSDGRSSNGGTPKEQGGEGSVLNSVLSGGWEAARDALLPAAEDAAGAAGEYLAEHGPDILRERIVPRFVDSFNEARGGT
ncbi:MAG: hypothetical protein ACJ75Q_08030 [Gaiellaceae bacterium]